MDDTITVHIQCVISSTIIIVVVGIHQNISRIKEVLRDEHGFRTDLAVLKLKGRLMKDSFKISEVFFDSNILLQLELLPPPNVDLALRSFDAYFRSATFSDTNGNICPARQVPGDFRVSLRFDDNLNIEYFSPPQQNHVKSSTVDMTTVFGARFAKERGFVQWTNHSVMDKLLIVEVSDPTLERTIDSVRYKWDGVNMFYSGGDPHSWQRYTRKIPISTNISVENKTVHIAPKQTLHPDTDYAVVLLHGVPPLCAGDTSPAERTGVHEDKLIFFRTKSTSSTAGDKSLVTKATSCSSVAQSENHGFDSLDSPKVELQIQPYYRIERYTAQIDVSSNTTLADVKSVVGMVTGLANKDFLLAINGLISVSDHDKMLAFKLKARNLLHVLPAFSSIPSRDIADYSPASSSIVSSYAPYIHSTFPVNGKMDVSVSAAISVQFQSVKHISRVGGMYHTLTEKDESLVANLVSSGLVDSDDVNSKSCDVDDYLPSMYHRQLMLDGFKDISDASLHSVGRFQSMCEVLGPSQAMKQGYKGWHRTSEMRSQLENLEKDSVGIPHNAAPSWLNRRVYLLEVADGVEECWKEIAYRFAVCEGGSGSYRGGDRDSWQRYTHCPPVRGALYVDNTLNRITFKPSDLLKSGTKYGLLLANGVPSVPDFSNHGSRRGKNLSDDWYSVQQDFMFFFTTAGSAPQTNSDPYFAGKGGKNTRVSSMADENLSLAQEDDCNADESCTLS